jgi:catalase
MPQAPKRSARFAIQLSAALAASASAGLLHAAPQAAEGQAQEVQAPQVVNSFEKLFGVHAGQRRNHTKGMCVAGNFIGTPAAVKLSRSALYAGTVVPVVGRLSLGGGDPKAADGDPGVRGLALEFRLPGNALQHITMINVPVFGAASPKTFNDSLIATMSDAKTGKPDPEKLKQFAATHPDAANLGKFLGTHTPPANYYNATYFGIHTFKFIDAKNVEHLVRWRFEPVDGPKFLTAAQVKSAPHDFLEANMIERVKQGPVKWNMIVSIGQKGDPEIDPTIAWPATRKEFTAGTLTLTEASKQEGAACLPINFDPLVMADGMAATKDPILLFRSPAYAVSFGKRLSGQ